MPIGVPRIIYCWGEELPAQWTDIYNFIFRRRMVFLMQYLDDELCNQICGLLINIHMEDRSKELEKKEIERSGLFKTASKAQKTQNRLGESQISGPSNPEGQSKKIAGPSFEDLLAADEDLGIDENNSLEQYTLQKITMEWLNWNAQFFDYSDEPYLFYLAEMLSKDFNKGDAKMLYSIFKTQDNKSGRILENLSTFAPPFVKQEEGAKRKEDVGAKKRDQIVLSQKEGRSNVSFMQFFEHFSSNSPRRAPCFATRGRLFNPLPPLKRGLDFLATQDPPNGPTHFAPQTSGGVRQSKASSIGLSKMRRARSTKSARNQSKNDWGSALPGNFKKPGQLRFQRAETATLLRPNPSVGGVRPLGSTQEAFGPFLPPFGEYVKQSHLDIYSPFRLLANFAAQDYNFKEINPLAYSNFNSSSTSHDGIEHSFPGKEKVFGNTFLSKNEEVSKHELFKLFNKTFKKKSGQSNNNNMSKLLTELGHKNFGQKINSQNNLCKTAEKALSQRNLRKEYVQDRGAFKTLNSFGGHRHDSKLTSQLIQKADSFGYLDFYSYNDSYTEFRNTQRGKQTERTLQEEEAKKVFVIINSFGGSVGNGITVHDALQFIKAGSLTLALGVAASAASLVLAGGTIGERYVTEGCHVMIHQPESSIQGQASDIWIDSQEIMKIRLDVAEIYSLATYRPRHKILRDLDRDFYLTATETIHYGLADEIATNEVMHEIIEMTSKVWDYHDTKQQRLLERRDTRNSGLDTQSQN